MGEFNDWRDELSDADKANFRAIQKENAKIAAMAPKPEEPVGPTVPSPHSTKVLQARQVAAYTSGPMNDENLQ